MTTQAQVALDRIFAAALGILVTYGAAAVLTPEQFGVFVLFETVRVGVLMCCDRTVIQAYVYYAAADPASKTATATAALMLRSVAVAILCSCTVTVLLIPTQAGAAWKGAFLWLPVWVALSMVQTTVQQSLTAEREYRGLMLSDAIPFVAFGAVLVFASGRIATPVGWMSLSCLARSLAGVVFVRRVIGPGFRVDSVRCLAVYRYAKASLVNNLASYVNLRADSLFLGFTSTLSEVARWGLVGPLVNVYMLIGEAANLELLPSVSSAVAAGKRDQIKESACHAARVWGGVAAVISVLVMVCPIERFLPGGPALAAGTHVMFAVVAVAGPPLVIARIFAAVNNGYGQPERNAQAAMLALASKLTMGLALIAAFGAVGAAYALVLATLVMTWVAAYYALARWGSEETAQTTGVAVR